MIGQGVGGRPTIAITAGEPAGIGPELVAHARGAPSRAAVRRAPGRLRRPRAPARRAARIGAQAHYADYDIASYGAPAGAIEVWHQPLAAPVTPGHPDPTNARSVLEMLVHAVDACATGAFAALVTAPVQKSVIQDAGIAFTGHTEFFAERTRTPRVVMLLVGGGLRVALATTHLPLAAVPAAITREAVRGTIAIVAAGLAARFAIRRAADRRVRIEPARGRGRPSRPRGDRRHRACDRRGTRSRHRRSTDRCRPTPCSCPPSRDATTPSSRCITTRGCRRSRRRASAMASTSRSACRSSARRSITAPRSISRPNAESARDADPGSLFAAVDLAIELAPPMSAAGPPQGARPPRGERREATPRVRQTSGHVPRKRFGQNFLVDPHYVARIVAAIDPRPGDNLVEIGPGLAALTGPLIERAGKHPRDRDRPRPRRAPRRGSSRRDELALHVADALDFDFATLGSPAARRRQPALQHQLTAAVSPRAVRAAARRSARDAATGSRRADDRGAGNAGLRSTLGDAAGELPRERLFVVPPGAFRPGAEGRLRRRTARPAWAMAKPVIADAALFARVVAAAFGQRRKTLRNALSSLCVSSVLAAPASTRARAARRSRSRISSGSPMRSPA